MAIINVNKLMDVKQLNDGVTLNDMGTQTEWNEIIENEHNEYMGKLIKQMIRSDRCPSFIKVNLMKLKEDSRNVAKYHWILLYTISTIPEVELITDGESVVIECKNDIIAASLELMISAAFEHPEKLMLLIEDIRCKERIRKQK